MHKIASFECICTKRTVRNFRTVSFDVAEADKIVGDITKYSWETAVRRIGQLAEKDKQIGDLQAKYKGEVFRHQQDNQEKDRIIRQKESIINDYRDRLGHYLSTLSDLLRGAVKAVIDYVQSGYRSFSARQEGDVRRYMNGQPDKDKAADEVFNASRSFLKSDECEKVKGQLFYIVQDMKEEQQQNRSRGFHR
jgi:hypothetical protein